MLEKELHETILNTLADEYIVMTHVIKDKIKSNKPGYCSAECRKDVQKLLNIHDTLKRTI
jgi:hypothetical protein